MITELDIFGGRVLSALLNGVYQGLLLTLLVWLALKLFPRTNAATRYAIYLVTLLMVAVLPVVHFALADKKIRVAATNASEKYFSSSTGILPVSEGLFEKPADEFSSFPGNSFRLQSPSPRENGARGEGETNGQSGPHVDEVLPSGLDKELDDIGDRLEALSYAQGGAPGEMPPTASTDKSLSESVAEPADAETNLPALPARLNWQAMLPRGTGLLAMGLWLGVAGWKIGCLFWQYGLLRTMKRRGLSVSKNTNRLFCLLCKKTKLRRRLQLLMSEKLSTPLVAGFHNPVILIPAALDEEPTSPGLEGVLRHELAHVQRRDDWTNLIQQVVRATLFFHPAVLWLSQRLTIDREIACDDYVLAATEHSRTYALYLTDFAGRAKSRDWAAAPAAWSNKSQLKERIDMILDTKRNASTRLGRVKTGALTATAVVIAALAFQAGPRVAFGQIQATSDSFLVESEAGRVKIKDKEDDKVKDKDKSKDELNSDNIRVEIVSEDGARRIVVKDVEETVSVDANGNVTRTVRSNTPVTAQVRSPRPVVEPMPAPADVRPPLAIPRAAVEPIQPMVQIPQGLTEYEYAPPSRRQRDDSLEERLERLERMIESLVNGQSPDKEQTFSSPDDRGGYDRGQAAMIRRSQQQIQEQVAREMEQARREIERAQQQAERQVQQARREGDLKADEGKASAARRLQQQAQENAAIEMEKARADIERIQKDAQSNVEEEIKVLQNLQREIENQKLIEQMGLLDQRQKETIRNAERVLNEQVTKFERDRNPFEQQKNQIALQRQALVRQREALERRMEQLDHEMDLLDDYLDRVDDQIDNFDSRMEDMNEDFEFESDSDDFFQGSPELYFNDDQGVFHSSDHEIHHDDNHGPDVSVDVDSDIVDAFGDEPRIKSLAE